MGEDKDILASLMEEHKDDFKDTAVDTDSKDEVDTDVRDKSEDNTDGEDDGNKDTSSDDDTEQNDNKEQGDEDETRDVEEESTGDDGDEKPKAGSVDQKNANSRIRQLIEEKRKLEAELEEQRQKERKDQIEAKRAKEDPVYTLDDFLGSEDDDGNLLSDNEAKAKYEAWKADKALRDYQREQTYKEARAQLIQMQVDTEKAYSEFPEFNPESDKYNPIVGEIAHDMFNSSMVKNEDGEVIGFEANPYDIIKKIHSAIGQKTVDTPVTKVNNINSDDSKMINSRQVNSRAPKYASGFRGEVDKELDKLIENRR